MAQILSFLAPYNSKCHCVGDVFWRETILTLYYIRGMTGPCGVHQQKDDTQLLWLNGCKIYHGKCCHFRSLRGGTRCYHHHNEREKLGRFGICCPRMTATGRGPWNCICMVGRDCVSPSLHPKRVPKAIPSGFIFFCLIFTICFNPTDFQWICMRLILSMFCYHTT